MPISERSDPDDDFGDDRAGGPDGNPAGGLEAAPVRAGRDQRLSGGDQERRFQLSAAHGGPGGLRWAGAVQSHK